jgi:hypothetical protein
MRLWGKSVSEKPKMTVKILKNAPRAAKEQNAGYIWVLKIKGQDVKLFKRN